MSRRKRLLTFSIMAASLTIFSLGEAQALSIDFVNHSALDFGKMRMGDVKREVPFDGVDILCRASAGTPGWTLTVRMDHPMTHVNDFSAIIPRENLRWYGIRTTDANNTSLNTTLTSLQRETTVYTGAAGEEETTITLKFELRLPQELKQGVYDTSLSDIIFTLTE